MRKSVFAAVLMGLTLTACNEYTEGTVPFVYFCCFGTLFAM